jgi:hypothetical protein
LEKVGRGGCHAVFALFLRGETSNQCNSASYSHFIAFHLRSDGSNSNNNNNNTNRNNNTRSKKKRGKALQKLVFHGEVFESLASDNSARRVHEYMRVALEKAVGGNNEVEYNGSMKMPRQQPAGSQDCGIFAVHNVIGRIATIAASATQQNAIDSAITRRLALNALLRGALGCAARAADADAKALCDAFIAPNENSANVPFAVATHGNAMIRDRFLAVYNITCRLLVRLQLRLADYEPAASPIQEQRPPPHTLHDGTEEEKQQLTARLRNIVGRDDVDVPALRDALTAAMQRGRFQVVGAC